jgi:hypothetical protein
MKEASDAASEHRHQNHRGSKTGRFVKLPSMDMLFAERLDCAITATGIAPDT